MSISCMNNILDPSVCLSCHEDRGIYLRIVIFGSVAIYISMFQINEKLLCAPICSFVFFIRLIFQLFFILCMCFDIYGYWHPCYQTNDANM